MCEGAFLCGGMNWEKDRSVEKCSGPVAQKHLNLYKIEGEGGEHSSHGTTIILKKNIASLFGVRPNKHKHRPGADYAICTQYYLLQYHKTIS